MRLTDEYIRRYALAFIAALTLNFLTISDSRAICFFGPCNYEECEYEKVKECNDNYQCRRAATRLCEKEFPYEKGKWKKVKWEDIENSEGKIQIVGTDFYTRLCFKNDKHNIEEDCIWWDHDTPISTRFSMSWIIENAFSQFLNSSKTSSLDGTTYSIYRAEKKRKGD